MRYNFRYGVFHWFIHYAIANLLVSTSNFHLVNVIVPFSLFGFTFQANVVDHFIIYVASSVIDLDHLKIYRRFGKEGIYRFGEKRIPLFLHNFFAMALFASGSALAAIYDFKVISVLLIAPVLHLLWDMLEDVVVFRVSYRKWEKTWGIGSEELETMWKEIEKLEKSTRQKS